MSNSMSCWVCVAALGLAMQQTPRLAEAATSSENATAAATAVSSTASAAPRIAYTIAFELGCGTALPIKQQPTWRLSVTGSGFDPQAGMREVSLSDVKEWCRAHELDDFCDEFVAGTTVPDLEEWADRAEALSGYFTPM